MSLEAAIPFLGHRVPSREYSNEGTATLRPGTRAVLHLHAPGREQDVDITVQDPSVLARVSSTPNAETSYFRPTSPELSELEAQQRQTLTELNALNKAADSGITPDYRTRQKVDRTFENRQVQILSGQRKIVFDLLNEKRHPLIRSGFPLDKVTSAIVEVKPRR